VWNFAEIYATLDAANGAKLIADEEALTAQLNTWLANPAARTAVAEAGAKTVRQLSGALDRTLAALDPYLVQLRLEQRASGCASPPSGGARAAAACSRRWPPYMARWRGAAFKRKANQPACR
jgi:hypothetical protein